MDDNFARDLIDQLGLWVNELARPLMPPRIVPVGDDGHFKFELREHIPHTVMIAKAVRAVSGLAAALTLADAGYVVECAALLRMVSDYCFEISTIGEALYVGGELPTPVRSFVDQYFARKGVPFEQFDPDKRPRYVSREDLLKSTGKLAERAKVDNIRLRDHRQYLNFVYDGCVHGSYESTMELFDPVARRFTLQGHPDGSKREEYIEAVFLKMHEAVVAVELTASVTANRSIFDAARKARHIMDASEPWKR